MMYQDKIIIRGLRQNNLKNVSLDIPKGKIVVFTGVSGSGKSSIVFDTIAAESQRQMNETYTAFMRGRLPKYEKLKVERIDNLSGGEAQRVKLAKYLDKKGNIYVLDEPTTGLHASDVQKVMELLDSLVERGNTVIVIEHNLDVMKQADWLIDVGPDGGTAGGEIVFTGTPREMAETAGTIMADYLRYSL